MYISYIFVGKLVLVQRERTSSDELLYSAPTVLAGQCEQVGIFAFSIHSTD